MRIPPLLAASVLVTSAAFTPAQTPATDHLPPDDRQLAHDLLKQLVETNTTDSVGSVTAAAQAMQQRLLEAGFPAADLHLLGPDTPAQNKGRKDNLVVRYPGRPGSTLKPILLIGHLDVVEAKPADWTTDPFHLTEKDGYLYGRGIQDMKDSDAALVDAFLRLHAEHFVPDRDLILALTADEEGGKSNGVDFLLGHHHDLVDAAFALNPDSGGPQLQNGHAVNLTLEATEKLYADFRLTSTNPGGHSSLPRPDNAIYTIADALTHLQNTPFPLETNEVTRAFFRKQADIEATLGHAALAADMRAVALPTPDPAAAARLSADPIYNSTLHTTCVATMLSGGHAPNALPGTATANVNCRILPGHSQEEVRQQLLRIFAVTPTPGSTFTLQYVSDAGDVFPTGSDRRSMAPSALSPELLRPLEAATAQIYPGIPILPIMEPGASDSIYTTAAGIPSFGVSGMGIDRDDVRAHGRDERIRLIDYDNGVQFQYLFLKALTTP